MKDKPKVKGGASPRSDMLSYSELSAFNKLAPKDRQLSTAELRAIAKAIREMKMSKGGTTMPMHGKKKKSKMMSKGGATKKSKMMSKGGKVKMMYGGTAKKKSKMMSRGGAARRR